MYQHYGKLQRYGYERYVPINQLDVKTLRDPFIDQAGRSREHPIHTLTDVVLRVFKNDELHDFAGTAIELSSLEVVVRLAGGELVDFFSDVGSAAPIGEVVFSVTGEVRRRKIDRLALDVVNGICTLRVNFGAQLDLAELVVSATHETVRLRIRIGTGPDPGMTEAARARYWLAQACDAAGAIVADLGGQMTSGQAIETGVGRIESMSVGSIEIALLVPPGAAATLAGIFWGWMRVRQAYWTSEKVKQEAIRLRWENERDGIRGSADLKPLVSRIHQLLRRRLGTAGATPNVEVDDERALTIAKKQLLPAAAEIIDSADGDVEVELLGEVGTDIAKELSEIRELPPPAGSGHH